MEDLMVHEGPREDENHPMAFCTRLLAVWPSVAEEANTSITTMHFLQPT
jgi:hypothetical protein